MPLRTGWVLPSLVVLVGGLRLTLPLRRVEAVVQLQHVHDRARALPGQHAVGVVRRGARRGPRAAPVLRRPPRGAQQANCNQTVTKLYQHQRAAAALGKW